MTLIKFIQQKINEGVIISFFSACEEVLESDNFCNSTRSQVEEAYNQCTK